MATEMPNSRFDGRQKKDWVRHNEQIRIPQVLVIHDGKNLGVMSNRNALDLARSHNLDLVEVSPHSRPPVCHIIDYGKYMYDRQKKQKESVSKRNQIREKEVDFRYVIADGDLNTKINQIRKFLTKGYKVKCVCKFRQRENVHKDQGFDVLKRVIKAVEDLANVEHAPKLDGNSIICKLEKLPSKKFQNKEDNNVNKKSL
jgi:translation initiation factor IF-3